MADLSELKNINADLPLTSFPDSIDDLESFSDADDEINSVIIRYKNLIKAGDTAKAEELYEQYSLKKYIIGANFLNKIQHMIIACERTISSVKKYFSFSASAPTGTTSQPNGYIWGKILSVGDDFKKVLLKLKENGAYVNIFPQTTADNVLMSEDETETVKDKLEELSENLNDANETLNETLNKKMDKDEPRGTGSIAMNTYKEIGINAAAFGTNNNAAGDSAFASGTLCSAGASNSFATGLGSLASISNQTVSGKYNETGNYAQIIGNGTSNDDRKNIYTVDWDGNVKAKSFNASGDIIYNDGKSLKALDETISNYTKTVNNHTDSINSVSNITSQVSGNFVIKNIITGTVESEVQIEPGAYDSFDIIVSCAIDEGVICIPCTWTTYTHVMETGYSTGVDGLCNIVTINTCNVSSSNHKTRVNYCLIKYKKIT